MYEVVIRAGTAVLPTGAGPADLGLEAGRIADIAELGTLVGREVVDATDCVVLPGSIDVHVHINSRLGPSPTLDDFQTGTIPAAFGGTTTMVKFAIPEGEESTREALERRRSAATDAAVVDYAFHAGITPHRFDEGLDTLKDLIEAGVGSVKVFTTYSGLGLSWDQLERVFEVAASHSLTVLAHAETDSIVAAAIDAEVEAGRLAPSGHPRSRPAAAEADAIERLGEMAGRTGAHLYVVHVSSAAGVDALRKLRREGIEVVGETCPQYLFLDSDVYDREDGELWICSPPIRSQTDQAALWSGLADGTLTVVGSDHNCFERSQKETHRHDFREVPNGLPGVEYRLPLLVHAALMGGLDWPDVARLAAETPARVFGLWPRKGVIAVGADADLAIVDPTAETDLGRGHMASDYSPFAHLSARGAIRQVWLRGRPIVDGGKLTVGPGYGRFLATNRG